MHRKVLWAVLAIGAALVIAPLALSLPSKTDAGERMLGQFEPIMQPDQVAATARYYDDVFTPLGRVAPAMNAENVAKFTTYLEGMKSVRVTPAAMARLEREFPQLAPMLAAVPPMVQDFGQLLALMEANVPIFAQVPAGLDHYEPLVRTMQATEDDYASVSSLPSFRLFTWFFVVPGALLVLLAGAGLLEGRRLHFPSFHIRPTHA